jgi:hypothetical protein
VKCSLEGRSDRLCKIKYSLPASEAINHNVLRKTIASFDTARVWSREELGRVAGTILKLVRKDNLIVQYRASQDIALARPHMDDSFAVDEHDHSDCVDFLDQEIHPRKRHCNTLNT